ncbi:MAG: hypothetical protein ACLQDF_14200 [Desulfomonilia bacterium]
MEIFFGFTIVRLDIQWYERGPLDMLSKALSAEQIMIDNDRARLGQYA